MKKKGGSVDDRSRYTRSSKEQGPNAIKDSSAEAFKTGTSSKNAPTEASVRKEDDTSHTRGSTQAGPTWGRGPSKGAERSDALPASSLTKPGEGTLSTSPTGEAWPEEEEEEDEDEQAGGDSARTDITNLEDGRGKQQKTVGLVIGVGAQAKITRGTLLFPAPIYSPGGPRNPKRHKNPNRWIRLIQRFASLRAQ